MKSKFFPGIVAFGVVLPLLLLLVLAFVILAQNRRVEKTFVEREGNFKRYQMEERQVKMLQTELETYRAHQEEWKLSLEEATIPTVSGLIERIANTYDEEELTKTKFNFIGRETGIASASSQPSVSFDLGYQGTFSAIQKSLLQLETEIPHLLLNKMKIQPDVSKGNLNVDLSYSLWSN
ncbi:MAG: hypothetical protein Q7Q71_13200 [Verrucomicrobiota bacterium JB023]|nr:hypothetical protein [Verrucomicrobiota bacterium JB023]